MSTVSGIKPVNILLVDDQPGKLLSYEAMLGGLGENLIRANSGDEALQHLLKTDIAVVLMDVCMPDVDGFEVAAMIRRHPRFQKTAIIHVSAVNLSDLDRLKGYDSGAVDYVSVPVVPEVLRAKVRIFADLYRKTEELERLNAELGRRVAERTEQLEAAAERLREADRRKDEFLATLAHELRNPLAALSSAVEVLRHPQRSDAQARSAEGMIHRQATHLARLVDDLVDVNRITRDRLTLRKERIDLGGILGIAVEGCRAMSGGESRIELTLPPEPILLDADSVRLTQVFLNLLSNAVKYTPVSGSIRIVAERQGGEAVVRVRDDGIGIAPDALRHVFEMFYQVDSSLERAQSGLGIGLTLARALVEMHGGTIEVRSAGLGHGSEGVVRLPLAEAGATTGTQGPAPEAEPARRRVVIADDNVDAAEALAELLRFAGHEVSTASDGEEALAIVARVRPDVVLLDLAMPRLNGYDVARRIRETPLGKGMVLVALTGWAQDEDRRRTHEAGFDVHLVKPAPPDAILDILSRLAPSRPL